LAGGLADDRNGLAWLAAAVVAMAHAFVIYVLAEQRLLEEGSRSRVLIPGDPSQQILWATGIGAIAGLLLRTIDILQKPVDRLMRGTRGG
jgi:hypothetical protein